MRGNSNYWYHDSEYAAPYPGGPYAIINYCVGDTWLVDSPKNSVRNSLPADPLFVDPANGDYRLQPGSPAIDAGDPASPLDPDGTRADIGAVPFDHNAPVAIRETAAPSGFTLSQNAPNPFNPSTVIRFSIPEPEHVRLAIHDATGRRVRLLIDEPMEKGVHLAVWNGTDGAGRLCASGVYLYRLTAGEFRQTRRMILVR